MKQRVRQLLPAVCGLAIPVLLMTGCSSAHSTSSPPGSSTGVTSSVTTIPSGGSNPPASASGALSRIRIRVVNLFAPNKQAGPAIDIYDVQLTGQKATPVATDIAYGTASPYFTPHLLPSSTSPTAELFALPAGEDPVAKVADAQSIGAVQDDGSHPQSTIILTAATGLNSGPLGGLSFSERVEKGNDNGSKGPVAPPAPAGQGEIMVDTTAVTGLNSGLYLRIDDSCAPPLNGDPLSKGLPDIFAADGVAPTSSFALSPLLPAPTRSPSSTGRRR